MALTLGVKLELQPTNPANRIPLLVSNKVNVIVADFIITPERAQQVDFSTPYFVGGQQFLAPKGKFARKDDLASARIGAVKGTTEEQALRKEFAGANVLSYDEISLALVALRNGNVQAITQDGALLAGLLAQGQLGGVLSTLLIALSSGLLALIIGFVLALLCRFFPRRLAPVLGMLGELVRGIPVLLLIFWLYFLLPMLLGRGAPDTVSVIAARHCSMPLASC